ncbi:IWS1-like protein [Dirofilaria immitis]
MAELEEGNIMNHEPESFGNNQEDDVLLNPIQSDHIIESEEGDIINHGPESFENNQEDDDLLNLIQSDHMIESEEGDIINHESGSFENNQDDDSSTSNRVGSDYMIAQTSDGTDGAEYVINNDGDDDEKDSSSSHSHSSVHETTGGMKEENVLDHDENLEQHFETKEKVDDDHINPENMDNEKEKADTSHEKSDDDSDDDEDKQAGPSRPRRIMLSSDEEDNMDTPPVASKSRDDSESEGDGEHGEVGVGELMTNIFGEDSDDEKEDEDAIRAEYQAEENGAEGDDDEPRYVRDENDEDDGRVWDFDAMMREKKAERRRPRRRRRDGSIDVGGAYDDQIKMLIDAMKAAAKDDRHSNMERRPALQKRKMLPQVKAMLIKHDLMEAIIDNGMMNVISEWLAPLPDKSLPALEIRTDLLKILQDFNRLEPGTLKQSGLGRAVMLLYKHPRETKENKALAARLISDWARPIFQLDTDFRSMTKDERVQRDYAQLPEAKRRRLDAGSESSDAEKEISEPRPGDKGFIMRARVPRPSQKDYVVRPKSNVEGQFRGATKNRSNSRFDRTQREFKERTKQQRTQRAVAVSINRVNL